MSDSLSDIFDIEPYKPTEVVNGDTSTIVVPEGEEDEDLLYARAKSYELIEKGSEGMNICMRILRETEDPKVIESLSKLIKVLSDANKTLLLLHKDKADIKTAKGVKPEAAPTVQTQNNYFVGNSKNLNRMIAEEAIPH
jgi:hypothetical protein